MTYDHEGGEGSSVIAVNFGEHELSMDSNSTRCVPEVCEDDDLDAHEKAWMACDDSDVALCILP